MSNSLLEDCAHDNARTTPGQTTGNCAVPKQYVHLHAEDAVLVTSWSQLGDDRYALTVRWPESATETDGASYDPRLLTQTLRQCCLLIAHAERAVPLDHQTLMDRMDFSIAQDLRVPRNAPAELSVTLACRSTGRRSMFVEMTLTHAGRQVAHSVIEFS
ncbi:MAG TPA: AfsA-related hotdog domain-containing protein, partial [Streptomyces sp.]|nr:AfsA-related hotdog domain-containing protein [Streptomyces sp.]